MIASVTGITGMQIKDARALLGWSYATLAERSGQALEAAVTIELGETPERDAPQRAAIQRALEGAGVEFASHGHGVRLRKG